MVGICCSVCGSATTSFTRNHYQWYKDKADPSFVRCQICHLKRVHTGNHYLLGRPSPRKGMKTGKPAHNRGVPPTAEAREKNRLWHLGRPGTFTGKHHTVESRKLLSIARTGQPSYWKGKKMPPHVSEMMSKLKKGNKNCVGRIMSSETRELIRQHHKQNADVFRANRLKMVIPFKDSKLEIKVQDALKAEGIAFRKHEALFGQPDIFIEPNICIFIDGDYYHANPAKYKAETVIMKGGKRAAEIWQKDAKITSFLQNRGYIVLRFWQTEINRDVHQVIGKIKLSIPIAPEIQF